MVVLIALEFRKGLLVEWGKKTVILVIMKTLERKSKLKSPLKNVSGGINKALKTNQDSKLSWANKVAINADLSEIASLL